MRARRPLPPILALIALASLAGVAPGGDPWMGSVVEIVPDAYAPGGPASGLAGDAEALFAQARAAAEAGQASRAFELATAAVRADPDHEAARRVLGYVRTDAGWRTPYEVKQHRRGLSWDRRFGWVRPEDLPRYEAGERRRAGRWVSAEADAAGRDAIEKGWTVRTDHFVVSTDHSLAAGAALAADLECFYQAWRTMFAGYLLDDDELRALFEGERPKRRRRPMRVVYHRDKRRYAERLRRRQPRIAETLGIYFDDRREAHFFHAEAGSDAALLRATRYHEATHQLFAENGPGRRDAGLDANFWLVEGVACYAELLAPITGRAAFTLGHPAQGRLPSAVADGPALPLAELLALGRDDFQRLTDLPRVYAQATGLVAMLRHGDGGDREALVRTLRGVYGGRASGAELPRQAGRRLDQLERDYRRFLANLSR